MHHNVKNIVDTLHNAETGRQVFEALHQVPTENLNDMHDMIVHILTERQEV